MFVPLLTAPTLRTVVWTPRTVDAPDVNPGEHTVEEVTDGMHSNLRTKKWGRFCCWVRPRKPRESYAARANSSKATLSFAATLVARYVGAIPEFSFHLHPSVDPSSPPLKTLSLVECSILTEL